MPRRMVYDIDVAVPAARMYQLFTAEDYWRELVSFYRDHANAETEITRFSSTEAGTDVTFRHIMTADDLPAVARPFVPGSFVVKREQHFDPFHATTNQASGRYRAHVPVAPLDLTGEYVLADTNDGSRLRLETVCRVKVPLIGGQIEGLIMGGLKMLFDEEGRFTTDWVAGHR